MCWSAFILTEYSNWIFKKFFFFYLKQDRLVSVLFGLLRKHKLHFLHLYRDEAYATIKSTVRQVCWQWNQNYNLNRGLKQPVTMTAMKTWEYKTSNGQNNISVNRVQTLQISQPFSANNNVKSPKFAWFENGNPDSKLLIFPFETQRSSHKCTELCTLCWSWGVAA